MAHDCVIELMSLEIDPQRNDDDSFFEATKHFLFRAGTEGDAAAEVAGYLDRYKSALKESPKRFLDAVQSDQMDNYLLGSVALLNMMQEDWIDGLVPAIPWAARNKKDFAGLKGEIANLRLLILMGFDVNAQDPDTGETALHLMSNLRWHTGAHPRAIKILLEAGADPNIKNSHGDNVLAYMAGSMPFEPVAEVFGWCVAYGGDIHSVSADGMSVLDILKDCQQRKPDAVRLAVIEKIELSGIARVPKKANPKRL